MTVRPSPEPPSLVAPHFTQPSASARHVARVRARLSRPATATGDAEAEARLYASLDESTVFDLFMAARTRFFDGELLRALDRGVTQIVLLGAGYDGRALRFRTPGVTFFEIDLPATQADKQRRLDAVGADVRDVKFGSADLSDCWLPDVLSSLSHDAGRPTAFLCEGVLLYLPGPAIETLLRGVRSASAGGSALVTTFAVATAPIARGATDEAPSASTGEYRQSFFTPTSALDLLARCGWEAEELQNPTPRRSAADDIALFARAVLL